MKTLLVTVLLMSGAMMAASSFAEKTGDTLAAKSAAMYTIK